MADNFLKDLFVQEKYDEVVTSLEIIFNKLFNNMLDYKKNEVKVDYENLEFDDKSLIIPDYYPRYRDQISRLRHIGYNPDKTYLDVINTMLNIYVYLSDTYKDDYKEDIPADYDGDDTLTQEEIDLQT